MTNELTYMPSMAPKSSNHAKLEEGGMQVLTKEDKETIELCRCMQKRGEYPPLLWFLIRARASLCRLMQTLRI